MYHVLYRHNAQHYRQMDRQTDRNNIIMPIAIG